MCTGRSDGYPRLVGDIGGTNARFALVAGPGEQPGHVRTLPCAAYPGPEEAIRDYLALEGLDAPRVAAFGIATPITGDRVSMTNHHWRFSVEALRAKLGLHRLQVINDFTALALSLQQLQPQELRRVGGGESLAGQPIALIGAGTGLGISGLVPCGEAYTPLEGEGGHITMPACTAREARIIAVLAERHGHVSAERLLSGPGLVALHDTIRRIEGESPLALSGADVSARALDGSCRFCVEALDTFCAMLGTVAGDLALTLGARGGVYIGGGIVPKLGDFFAASAFRQRFEDKGRFAPYLARIPVYVIHAAFPALLGAALALETQLSGGCDARAAGRKTADFAAGAASARQANY